MNRRLFLLLCALSLASLGLSSAASAENSHARIVRLSLVQGDVRFASAFHEDPLTDAKADWQTAPLNLPIRQGFILATDNGRAEVEFENGAMLFLGANTVVEFYDLSLQDGARITRLVLRQGSATSYVNPANGDYFSLTGGDFTVEAAGRTTFRLDNFDDGSTVNVEQGHANVLRDKKSTPLSKGQSLSVHAGDSADVVVARAADPDDFDHWVSGRVDSVVTATNYSSQYVNSPGYSAGFADLYTYGSWYPMAGYGNCWRPFGVGLGWSPFDYGAWYQDASFGSTFVGFAPWGWLPYHYGGWLFSPVYGWVWAPVGFGGYGGPGYYRPVTAVWVRNGTAMGIVPLHPGDKYGKTAQNLNQGIYPVQNSHIAASSIAATSGKWSVLHKAPTEVVASNVASSSAPVRVSRTIAAGPTGSNRMVGFGRNSSISYDPVEHRYVNSGNPAAVQQTQTHGEIQRTNGVQPGVTNPTLHGNTVVQPPNRAATPQTPASARIGTPPRAPAVPAPPRANSGGGFGRSSAPSGAAGGAVWGGSGGSSSGASHPSMGGSGSHPSGGGSGGGSHPH
jgi:FecR protein